MKNCVMSTLCLGLAILFSGAVYAQNPWVFQNNSKIEKRVVVTTLTVKAPIRNAVRNLGVRIQNQRPLLNMRNKLRKLRCIRCGQEVKTPIRDGVKNLREKLENERPLRNSIARIRNKLRKLRCVRCDREIVIVEEGAEK